MKVTLPANTTLNEVWIPYSGKGKYKLLLNGKSITASRIRNFIMVDNIGSGSYKFELIFEN
jgi:hypothetical protein